MTMVHKDARYAMAAVQGILGWEWLVSGSNKVLSGTFSSGLGGTLSDGLKGNPNGWYVAFVQSVILPHSLFFGYVIETVEVLAGIALVAGALLLIGGPRRRGEPQYRMAVSLVGASVLAALTCIFLCVNFHFFMGDGILPGIDPFHPYNEGISLDTLMAPMALVTVVFNVHVLSYMTGVATAERLHRVAARLRALTGRGHTSAPAAAGGSAS
jgi:thiosulfate dehydrogenase [quinone] large subunit